MMEYLSFKIDKPKMCKQINAIKKDNKRQSCVYNAEYPPFAKKVVYKDTAISTDRKTVAGVVNEYEERTDCCTKTQNGGLQGVLCLVLAFALLLCGVYLAKIPAPDYVENAVISLVGFVENEKVKDEIVTAVSEKVKVIGGKLFVESQMGEIDEHEQSNVIIQTENSRFAETVRDVGATEKGDESENGLYVTNLQEQNNEPTVQVIGRNMSKGSDKIYLTNRTELVLDGNDFLTRNYPIEKITYSNNKEPLVLIIHTHGTEAYINTGDGGNTRSENTDKNIVRVGAELKNVLEYYGIPTIHSKTMHDKESYVNAYASSKKEAMEYLNNYPSIKYVIDVHRDALGASGETPVKTYAEINGESTAQLMFVMGTNASGGNHPNYLNNLTVAAHIQNKANQLFPELMRPLNIRPIVFNQNLADGCMLLEVGSDANTLSEALEAVRMFGRCFAETVIE